MSGEQPSKVSNVLHYALLPSLIASCLSSQINAAYNSTVGGELLLHFTHSLTMK